MPGETIGAAKSLGIEEARLLLALVTISFTHLYYHVVISYHYNNILTFGGIFAERCR